MMVRTMLKIENKCTHGEQRESSPSCYRCDRAEDDKEYVQATGISIDAKEAWLRCGRIHLLVEDVLLDLGQGDGSAICARRLLWHVSVVQWVSYSMGIVTLTLGSSSRQMSSFHFMMSTDGDYQHAPSSGHYY